LNFQALPDARELTLVLAVSQSRFLEFLAQPEQVREDGSVKCNVRRIVDYESLQGYLMDLYQQPGIAETVNFDHIKRHYYYTHDAINPTRIVPKGPATDWQEPHGRG
jgi:glutathionyl-hydroquinone reductase